MKVIVRWGGLLGAFGGLVWAVLFFMEATTPGFDLRYQLLNQPAVGLTLVLAVALQASGYFSLSAVSEEFSTLRISALVCAAGASAQSVALFAVSALGLGAAWLLGILGELVITIALGAFAVSSLSAKLRLSIKLIPLLMVPFYFVGWAVDPESIAMARLDIVNLSAAIYGLLWMPFGYAIWDHSRDRLGADQSGVDAA